MSFATTQSAQTSLLYPYTVNIEIDTSKGLHSFSIVGLPDKAVEESRDRVSAAIKNSGFTSPKSKNQKVVVSLAPASIKKEGPLFDLGIAICYLSAVGDIKVNTKDALFLGELSLNGELRKVNGILPLVRHAKQNGFDCVFLPHENAEEAALIDDIEVYPANTLLDVINHLDTTRPEHAALNKQAKTKVTYKEKEREIGFHDIKGQRAAKRGLLIAAAGGHNIVLSGPAGTGKTMLARAFTGILPPLSFEDVLETTAIHSVAGTLDEPLITHPPFRSPHHTASYVSVVGGGTIPKPGEVTLAHKGVLFLDEFPEFERRVIDSLRQPLEDFEVHISRIKGTARFPAQFILVAAMNPCPCGNYKTEKECVCSPQSLLRYQKKISGPIIDRMDMWIDVPHVETKILKQKVKDDSETQDARKKVEQARHKQQKRFVKTKNKTKNSEMSVKEIDSLINLSEDVQEILDNAVTKLNLSPRVYHRLIKVARTIADLENSTEIQQDHILEAISYRKK